jgi:hypothetical protein
MNAPATNPGRPEALVVNSLLFIDFYRAEAQGHQLDAIADDPIPRGQHSAIASYPERGLVNFVDCYRPQEIQAAIRNTEPASMLTRLPATQQLFANAAAIAESPSGL